MRFTLLTFIVVALVTMQSRAAAPATEPKAPVHVVLPDGWVAKTPQTKSTSQFAGNPDLVAYFELIAEPKSDFSDDVDLMAWAKLVKANSTKASTLANRAETDLKEGNIAGHATVEYEVTGELKGLKLHYRIIMLQVNEYFCKLPCWTTPSHWDASQPKFEELISNLH